MTAPVVASGYHHDSAASVRGLVARFTRLGPDGSPTVGSACDVYITSGFVRFSFTPEYQEGEEISITSASGAVCVYYKSPDSTKGVNLNLELCDPDPVLTAMLAGGDVLEKAGSDACAPMGSKPTDKIAVGYAAAKPGDESYGVAVEVWAQAVVGGKAASGCPYWHYLIPYAKFRLDGDRVIENGNLATVFAGTGGGNSTFGSGPRMDLTGVSPTPPQGAFEWEFPSYTDRSYAYARTSTAPIGLQGCYTNLGVPIVAVTAGIPATLAPVTASRPRDLTTLKANPVIGDSGSNKPTAAWTTGQFLSLLDGSQAYWDGTAWQRGAVPAPVIAATGATAGSPGSYTGAGGAGATTKPANLAGLSGLTATPSTLWTAGQFVELTDGTTAYWDSSKWVLGKSPGPVSGVTAGTPGSFTPAASPIPATLAELAANPVIGDAGSAKPGAAWTTGQNVALGTGTAFWDGAKWATGTAP